MAMNVNKCIQVQSLMGQSLGDGPAPYTQETNSAPKHIAHTCHKVAYIRNISNPSHAYRDILNTADPLLVLTMDISAAMHQQLQLPSSFSQLVLYLSGSASLLGGPMGKGKQEVYLADLSGSVR